MATSIASADSSAAPSAPAYSSAASSALADSLATSSAPTDSLAASLAPAYSSEASPGVYRSLYRSLPETVVAPRVCLVNAVFVCDNTVAVLTKMALVCADTAHRRVNTAHTLTNMTPSACSSQHSLPSGLDIDDNMEKKIIAGISPNLILQILSLSFLTTASL